MTFTFIIRGLVGGFWSCAAALSVLAAAGRLAADLPVFSIHLSLQRSTGITLTFSDKSASSDKNVWKSRLNHLTLSWLAQLKDRPLCGFWLFSCV